MDRAKLEKELDGVFSLYIRNRGAVDGWNRCITCNYPFPIDELDCGHFISRKHLSVRWDERNAFPQCVECNRLMMGREDIYEAYLIDMGVDVDELRQLARKPRKYSLSELNELIDYYKAKLNESRGV